MTFEIIIYQGSSPSDTNSPQVLVFIGESDEVFGGFNNTYMNTCMRYQDLVDRLGPNQASFYKGDQDRFNATPSQLRFPAWDMSGGAPNFGLKYESFKAFQNSPSMDRPKEMLRCLQSHAVRSIRIFRLNGPLTELP